MVMGGVNARGPMCASTRSNGAASRGSTSFPAASREAGPAGRNPSHPATAACGDLMQDCRSEYLPPGAADQGARRRDGRAARPLLLSRQEEQGRGGLPALPRWTTTSSEALRRQRRSVASTGTIGERPAGRGQHRDHRHRPLRGGRTHAASSRCRAGTRAPRAWHHISFGTRTPSRWPARASAHRHPTPARPYEPGDPLDPSAGHRQDRDHRHRPLRPLADGPGRRNAPPLTA
jgi:hypothetical protein